MTTKDLSLFSSTGHILEKDQFLLKESRRPRLSVIAEVMIPSESIPGDYNKVKIYENGSADCECVGFNVYKVKECWHIRRSKEMLKNS